MDARRGDVGAIVARDERDGDSTQNILDGTGSLMPSRVTREEEELKHGGPRDARAKASAFGRLSLRNVPETG